MVVSKQAVQCFLERRRKDSNKAKRFSDRALDAKLRKLGARFHTPPYRHQKIAFLLGARHPGYLLLLDPGLGKSKVALDLLRWREARRALVLVPNVGNIGAWEAEADRHAPQLSVGLVIGAREQRQQVLQGGSALVVATYQGLLHLVCRRTPGKKGKGKLALDRKLLAEMLTGFDMAVFDESTALMNHRSLTFEVCKQLARLVPYRYALTGTPFDKDPAALWSQFYAVDQGETLGETLGLFRAAFFTEKPNYWSGGKDYEFDRRKSKQLARVLRNRSVRFSERETLDLPPAVGGLLSPSGLMLRSVPMSVECARYYDAIVKEIKTAKGNFQVMENAYVRMRQLTAGFLTARDEDEGKHVLPLQEQPKLEALAELLAELPSERKVIVWHHFRMSGKLICERLHQLGIGHWWLWSGSKDRRANLARFNADPSLRVLVSSSAGAFGLNLQVANYCVFYESPDSSIVRQQAERRIHRQGQTRRTYYWDLVVRGSVDQRLLEALVSGKHLLDELVAGRVQLAPAGAARS